jgi:hypothetical protein
MLDDTARHGRRGHPPESISPDRSSTHARGVREG